MNLEQSLQHGLHIRAPGSCYNSCRPFCPSERHGDDFHGQRDGKESSIRLLCSKALTQVRAQQEQDFEFREPLLAATPSILQNTSNALNVKSGAGERSSPNVLPSRWPQRQSNQRGCSARIPVAERGTETVPAESHGTHGYRAVNQIST